MIYLTKTDLIHLNQRLLEKAGKGTVGVQYPEGLDVVVKQPQQILFGRESVSYTHLTLPTTLHECRSRWSPYH